MVLGIADFLGMQSVLEVWRLLAESVCVWKGASDTRVSSLSDDQNRLVAQRRITMDSGARRAEHIRRTANVELQKLDDVTAMSRAMAMKLKHNYSPGFSKGDIV